MRADGNWHMATLPQTPNKERWGDTHEVSKQQKERDCQLKKRREDHIKEEVY